MLWEQIGQIRLIGQIGLIIRFGKKKRVLTLVVRTLFVLLEVPGGFEPPSPVLQTDP